MGHWTFLGFVPDTWGVPLEAFCGTFVPSSRLRDHGFGKAHGEKRNLESAREI